MISSLILTLMLAPPAQADPLILARQGMAQCYTPNMAARTCRALATYEFHPDGRITNYAEVLLNPEPAVVMQAATAVHIRDSAVCGTLSDSDILELRLNGEIMTGPLEQQVRQVVLAQRTGEGEICTTYAPGADATMTYTVTIGGKQQPDDGDTVLWVDPAEGWTVAP